MPFVNANPITPVFLVDGYGNAVTLNQNLTLPDGAVYQVDALTVNVNGFNYDIGGIKGYFEGALNQPVVDNSTNYIFYTTTSTPILVFNTTGYPATPHLRLARVFTSSGIITSIILDRAFLTAGDEQSILAILTFPTDLDASDGYVGSSIKASRADHKHKILTGSPIDIGTSNLDGSANTLARSDHQHNHGNLAGGALHSTATTSTAGFLSSSDKTKLDGIDAGATNTPLSSSTPTSVDKSSALAGASTFASRADHKHDISTASAITITTSNTEGTATTLARSDHTHDHGSLPGGSLHSQVTTSVDGFMIASDKTKLDGIESGAQAVTFTHVNTALGTANTSINVNNQKIVSLLDPTNSQDAATKFYVDSVATGMDIKTSCRAATTTNITLSGLQTIDGVSVIAGNRVLVKNQTTAYENGIYVVSISSWTRSADADQDAEVTSGLFTFIEEGTVNANSGWILITPDPITIDATQLTFSQFTGAGQINAGAGLTKTGNTLDINANADGSIIVNTDDIQVGILATDAQHGNRGSGSLHAVATTSVAGFLSSSDKTKLDGVANGATNTPLASTAPEDVDTNTAIIGISTTAARSDHKHSISVGTPITIGITNSTGTATSLARSDHQHNHGNQPGGTLHSQVSTSVDGFMIASDKTKLDGIATGATNTPLTNTNPVNVTKASASPGASIEAARADHKHDISTSAPINISTSNLEGTATTLARSDHQHNHGNLAGGNLHAAVDSVNNGFMISTDKTKLDGIASGATNTPLSSTAPVDVDVSTAIIGVGTTAARADHKHNISVGTPTTIGTVNSAGTATSLVRSDHVHAHGNQVGGTLHAQVTTSVDGFMIASDKVKLDSVATGATNTPLSLVAPSDVTKSTAIIGVSTSAARADHKHDISTATPVSITTVNAEGTATSLARSDHTHNHGNLVGGTLHAQVTTSVDGFMIASDKTKLDGIETGAQVVTFARVQTALNAATGSIGVNNQKITGLADPTNAQDAATKNYVDSIATGLDVKASCRVATTTNITLSGPQTIDGISAIAGDRVLVKNQSTASQNGLYVVNAGAWTRTVDADQNAEVTSGLFTFIEEGTINASSGWILTTANPIAVGSTSLNFSQFSGAGQITAGSGLTKSGNTLNIGANADGSIIVNADDIQVGVLATDVQHGNRGNGSLHSIATTSVNGFMSASDKTKLDSISTGATNTPLTNTLPVNVSKATAVVGVSTEAARADHKHNIDTAVAVSLSTSNTEGTATTLARSDHTHDHANQAGGTLHAAVTTSINGFMIASDKTKLDGIATGATNTPLASTSPIDVDASAAVIGVGTTAARADHKHNISTASPSILVVGGSNTIGTSTALARADHLHALPAYGTTAGTFCQGNDSRLSDKRAPTITSEATGDIMYFNGTNWVRLAASTANNILITNGVGTAPSWTSASNIIIFGTQFNQITDDTVSTNLNTTFINKLSLSLTGVPAGNYYIGWYSELSVSAANRDYAVQITVDTVNTVASVAERLVVQNIYTGFSGFDYYNLTAGNHTINLDFARSSTAGAATISIRNARLVCWRVS